MAFTVEDGTGIVDANSYVSVAEFIDFAGDRGVTVEDTDATRAALVTATDWLETMSDKFIGEPTYPPTDDPVFAGQGLAWPRTVIDCETEEEKELGVPKKVKTAQMHAAMAVNAGVNLMPTSAAQAVKREKVDVLEVEYFGPVSAPEVIPAAEAIAPLLVTYRKPGQGLRTVRA